MKTDLIELSDKLNKMMGIDHKPVLVDTPRPSDQIIYISDISKVSQDFNWRPKTNLELGLSKTLDWLNSEKLDWV